MIAVSNEYEIDMWTTVLAFEDRYSMTVACHKQEFVIFCLLETSVDLLGWIEQADLLSET